MKTTVTILSLLTILSTSNAASKDGCFEFSKVQQVYARLTAEILKREKSVLVANEFGTLLSSDSDGQSTAKQLVVTKREGYGNAVWRMKINTNTCAVSYEPVR